MANFYISPNMSLVVPVPSVDPGPDWASNLNASLTIVDAHTHNPGSGIQITPTGMNINADLTFLSHNATGLRSARFVNQASVLNTAADLTCAYSSGTNGDLYYNDINGNKIQMTKNGSPNSGTGNISGLPSTPVGSAGIGWQNANSTFQFLNDAGTSGANIDVASVIIRYPGSYPTPSGNYIVFEAPSSLSSGYALTLPALPSQTNVMSLGTSGIISSITYDQVGQGMTSVGANAVLSQVTSANASVANTIVGATTSHSAANTIALLVNTSAAANNVVDNTSSANLPGVPTAANRNIIVASDNSNGALKMIRGFISAAGTITNGEGFTVVRNSTGDYTMTFSVSFSSAPAVVATAFAGSGRMAVVSSVASNQTEVVITDLGGTPQNTQFLFIAIGPV